ncbi:head GIN domain-containing protein [Pacificimonas sp. ICDLI1SI03]
MRTMIALGALVAGIAMPASAAEKSWMIGNFEAVDVGGSFDVDVVTGRAQGVVATGPQNELDKMQVDVSSGTLKLRSRKDDKWFSWSDGGDRVQVRVTVPRLSKARLSGSGDVIVDEMTGTDVSLALSGSGNLKVGAVRSENLALFASGSGDIGAAGECRSGDYSVTGSGKISAADLACRDLAAKVTGSGDILASASRTAKANIMGSGDISITGGADCETRVLGSGDVRCN